MDKLQVEIYPPQPPRIRSIHEMSAENAASKVVAREAVVDTIHSITYAPPKPSANPLYHQDPLPPDEDTVGVPAADQPSAENKIEETPQEVPFVWQRKPKQ